MIDWLEKLIGSESGIQFLGMSPGFWMIIVLAILVTMFAPEK